MSTYARAFNNHLNEMCEDLLKLYPSEWELKKAYNSMSLLQKSKPSIIIKFWRQFTLSHQDEIETDAVTFFISYDFNNSDKVKNSVVIDTLEKLKKSFMTLHTKEREQISQYILNLTKLSHLYENA